MNYSIVYSSPTGNTEQLAKRLKATLDPDTLCYYGAPAEDAREAELIFVGFWTDKGSADTLSSDFLKTLHQKKIFLFGTAGFGGNDAYFSQILSRVQENLEPSNTVIGSYMCQGKMPLSVRKRYEAMQAAQPEKMQTLLENFDSALSHPDIEDLLHLEEAVRTLKELA